jgi:hypothetical protein
MKLNYVIKIELKIKKVFESEFTHNYWTNIISYTKIFKRIDI